MLALYSAQRSAHEKERALIITPITIAVTRITKEGARGSLGWEGSERVFWSRGHGAWSQTFPSSGSRVSSCDIGQVIEIKLSVLITL